MEREEIVKRIQPWTKRLDALLRGYKAIFLTGNVKDVYFYEHEDGTFSLYSMLEFLMRRYQNQFDRIYKYELVTSGKSEEGVEGLERIGQRSGGSANTGGQSEFGIAANKQSKGVLAEIQAEDKLKPVIALVNRLISAPEAERWLLIFPTFDKLFPNASDGNVQIGSIDDIRYYLILEKLITEVPERHRLVFFLPEEGRLQSFLKKFPQVKTLYIPQPSRMDIKGYWALFKSFRDEKEIETYTNHVQDLPLSTIHHLVEGIERETVTTEDFLNQLEKSVQMIRIGEETNPWQEISVKKLEKFGDFFLREVTEGRPPVTGQDHAIKKIYGILLNAVADIHVRTGGNPYRPKGVLFFAGPTGVGKTLIAQKLAIYLFGSESKLLRFDMSEYAHEHQVERLYGAPPGYVGFEEGGQLTNGVKNNPFSVILFDEIEKAHPRVMDIFLQILSDGRLTDSKGDTVYFNNTIIIFTSNKGHDRPRVKELIQQLQKVGDDEKILEEIRDQFKEAVRQFFKEELKRPEILGRIGEENIIAFNPMTPSQLDKILEGALTNLRHKWNSYQVEPPYLTLEYEDLSAIKRFLFEKHKDTLIELGARQVENILREELYSQLSTKVLEFKRDSKKEGTIFVFVDKEKNKLRVKEREGFYV